jgi:hypothetical protein
MVQQIVRSQGLPILTSVGQVSRVASGYTTAFRNRYIVRSPFFLICHVRFAVMERALIECRMSDIGCRVSEIGVLSNKLRISFVPLGVLELIVSRFEDVVIYYR